MFRAPGTVEDRAEQRVQLPDELTSAEGTLEFVMEMDRPYRSGRGTETSVERLLTFPGLGRVEFRPAPGGARLW